MVERREEVEPVRLQGGREELEERKDDCYRRVKEDSPKFVSSLHCRPHTVLLLWYYQKVSSKGDHLQLELEMMMRKIMDHHCYLRGSASYGGSMHVREVEQVAEVVRVRYPASESSIGEERESSRWGEIEREGVTSESLKLAGGDARESIGLCSVCVVSVRAASGESETEITWRTIRRFRTSVFAMDPILVIGITETCRTI